jgi:uncharacterized protein YegJ (DUF2314 family)
MSHTDVERRDRGRSKVGPAADELSGAVVEQCASKTASAGTLVSGPAALPPQTTFRTRKGRTGGNQGRTPRWAVAGNPAALRSGKTIELTLGCALGRPVRRNMRQTCRCPSVLRRHMNTLVVLAISAVLAFLFLRWRRNLVLVDEASGVSQIRSDDADMRRAVVEARANFGHFLERLRHPGPQDQDFGVKVAIGHDGSIENLWICDVRVEGDVVEGTIANDPVQVPFRSGDAWRGCLEQVVDWAFLCDGRMQGNFSLRAMLPRMPSHQQQRFRGMLEGRWDTVELVHRPWPADAAMPGRPLPAGISHGDPMLMDAVPRLLERHLGAGADVFHEIVSPSAHIDLYPWLPTPARPFVVIATTGMAEQAMQLPTDGGADPHLELLALLPPDWPMDSTAWNRDERGYWPLRWLKRVARFHYESGHWLGEGHLLDHGDPPRAIGDSGGFVAVLLAEPTLLPPETRQVVLPDGRSVRLLQLYFLDAEARAAVDTLGWREVLARRQSGLSIG